MSDINTPDGTTIAIPETDNTDVPTPATLDDLLRAVQENTSVHRETQALLRAGLDSVAGLAEQAEGLFGGADGKPPTMGSLISSVFLGR